MKVLSLDIGASNGRFVLVNYFNNEFSFEETYRFNNEMEFIEGHYRWNFKKLFSEILKGLKISLSKHEGISSLGVDTWAVDYGRLDANGNLIADPISYRDIRNKEAAEKLLEKINYEYIYNNCGIQYLNFNSIFQLFDDKGSVYDLFLLMPDLICYYLTGKKFCEITNFSTTCLYDPQNRSVSLKNMGLIGMDTKHIAPFIEPSKLIGKIKKEICDELGIYDLDVISVGSHDTASAIASLKLDEKSAYLSSGTWSLIGVELKKPLINKDTLFYNFTNEVGLEHTNRFLKNIMGLFIIQEVRKEFNNLSFQEMNDAAKKIDNNNYYIDVDDEIFSTPSNMIGKIYSFLKKTNQKVNELSYGELSRMIYESMAFKYIESLKDLELLTNRKIEKLVVIGGGINSDLLNQLIANSLNIIVVTGENEATICGNALAQLIYYDEFSNLDSARKALEKHTEKKTYYPEHVEFYKTKYQNYLKIIEK